MEEIDSEQSEEMISINRTFKNFFKLIITRTIMRTIIKGMTLLLAGVSFMACSKDVTFDENAQNQAKAEAELAQKFATYESDFGKTFGTVAAGHKWGFDQTTGITTRTAVTTTDDYWLIPENLWGGSQNKEGWDANSLHAMYVKMNQEGGMLSSVSDFSFDNYFLQHVEKVQGGQVKHSVAALEAYNSNTGNWEAVTNFEAGDNPSGTFQITAPNTDFFAPKNKSAAGTTLMANMGGNAYNNEDDADDPGNGKIFRLVMKEDKHSTATYYNYNYGFFRAKAWHKDLKRYIENELFLAIQLPPKNQNKDNSYWIIRLGVAEKATVPDPVLAEGRVLCEDMGANDFDFNDVVFDATIYRTGETKIKVLAHGGVLPVAIDGVPVTLGKMTNTGMNEAEYQEFTIAAVNGQPKYSKIEDIPVTVDPNGEAGYPYNLEAKVGSAPQKVCVPINTRWPDEYILISKAYTPFDQWVNTTQPSLWTMTVVSRLTDLIMENNADDWTEPVGE